MTTDPLWINVEPISGAPKYTAAEMRGAMGAAMLGGVAHRLGSRQGVRPGLAVASLAGTTWTVHSHPAVVYPGLTSTAGAYWVTVPADSGTTSPADGTNPRKDLLVVRVYDDDEDSLGRRDCDIEYVIGAPAVTPVEPAVPAGAMKVATITVPVSGGGDPTIVVNAPYTVASGGLLPVRDSTERPTDGLYDGLPVWRQDTSAVEVWDGSAWSPIYAGDTGWLKMTTSASFSDVGNGIEVRKVGAVVKMRGSVNREAGIIVSGSADINMGFTLPAATWPVGVVERLPVGCNAAGPDMWILVKVDGTVHLYNRGDVDMPNGSRLDFGATWIR